MNGDFKKFKNKIWAHAIIESAVAGLAAGLILVGTLLLAFTLSGISLNVGIYIGAGIGAFAIAGGVTFFILRPTEKKIARRVDGALGMNEKVQTMVAFSSSQEPMVAIQRADTSARLSAAGTKNIKFRRLWQCSVAAFVAVGLFSSAIVVSAMDIEPTQPIDDKVIERLNYLIKYVDASSMADEPKQVTIDELNGILNAIYDDETQTTVELPRSELVSLVTQSMVDIDAATDAIITAEPIGLALNSGADADSLAELGIHIASLTVSTTRTSLQIFANAYTAEATAEMTYTDLSLELAAYSTQIVASLAQSGVSVDDGLYSAIFNLSNGLLAASTANGGEGASEDDDKAALLAAANSAITESISGITGQITYQYENRDICMYVIDALQETFEISDDEMPDLGEIIEDVVPGDGNDDNGDGEEDPSGGGAGRGDDLVASDSEIYDYRTESYVKYGELLDEYNSIILSYISDGERIPSGYIEMINAYLDALTKVNSDSEGQN